MSKEGLHKLLTGEIDPSASVIPTVDLDPILTESSGVLSVNDPHQMDVTMATRLNTTVAVPDALAEHTIYFNETINMTLNTTGDGSSLSSTTNQLLNQTTILDPNSTSAEELSSTNVTMSGDGSAQKQPRNDVHAFLSLLSQNKSATPATKPPHVTSSDDDVFQRNSQLTSVLCTTSQQQQQTVTQVEGPFLFESMPLP